jgi:hypothetical protein
MDFATSSLVSSRFNPSLRENIVYKTGLGVPISLAAPLVIMGSVDTTRTWFGFFMFNAAVNEETLLADNRSFGSPE